MKKIFFLIALIFTQFNVFAQNVDILLMQPGYKIHNHELGVFSQSFHGEDQFQSQVMLGLYYKKRLNNRFLLRANLAYNPTTYGTTNRIVNIISSDSVTISSNEYNINIFMLGLGLEYQYQLYKKWFLFAAVDGYVGYGKGKYSVFLTEAKFNNGNFIYDYFDIRNRNYYTMNQGFIKMAGAVGLKVLLNRIALSSEIGLTNVGTTFQNINGYKNNGFEAYAFPNNVSIRTAVAYRFY